MRFGKRIEVCGKRMATWLLARLLSGSTSEVGIPPLSEIRSVLLVRPNFRMGNMLMVTPAIRGVRQELLDASIGLVTTSSYSSMLNECSDLNDTHVLTRGMSWQWWKLVLLIREIRFARYDLVVDCSEGESLLGAAFAVFSGARFRLGPKGSKQEAVFNLRGSIDGHSKHRIMRLLLLLGHVGIKIDDYSMVLSLNVSQNHWAAVRWKQLGCESERPVVGINLGARGDKRWPLSCFKALIDHLILGDCRVLLFAGPEELDRLASLKEGLPAEVCVDTTDEPCLFAALLKKCSVFVTSDTGPMHLAVAVGTPTVAIFTRSNFEVYGPLGPDNRIVHDPYKCEINSVLSAVKERIDPVWYIPMFDRHATPAV